MTDSTIALIERLKGWQFAPKISPVIDSLMSDVSQAVVELTTLLDMIEVKTSIIELLVKDGAEQATELTTLLQRCEKAEERNLELELKLKIAETYIYDIGVI